MRYTQRRLTPETLVKREIRRYLGMKGWYSWPIMQTMGSYPGLPDIQAMRDGVTLHIECKAPKGKQSPHQAEFERMVSECVGRDRTIRYILARSADDLAKEGI